MAKKDRDILRPAAPPQPTKRDRVIAQRIAQAAQGDTPLSIANANNIPIDDLLNANPGVVTVRPGQNLNIPRAPLAPITSYEQSAVGNNSGYVSNGSVSTTNQYGAGINRPAFNRGTAGYWANYNQANTGVIPQIQSSEQAAVGNNSGYAMQGGGVSTTNQYGSNITSYNGTAGYWGRGNRTETPPKSSGGFMPSLVPQQSNLFAGSGAMVGVGTIGGQTNFGNYTSPYNGFQTPTSSTPVNRPAVQPAAYTGTAGYWGAYNQQQGSPALQAARAATPHQPSMGSPSYMNPALRPQASNLIGGDKQGQLGTSAQPTAAFPTDDKGKPIPYTGNPNDPNTQIWKDYWNASARAGVDLAGRIVTPKVMTRDQIWEMKAAQRRRRAMSADTGGGSYDAFSYDTGYADNGVAPELVRNITWGI